VADWAVWLVAAGVLLLAELFTLTFVLGLVSAAALLTAIGGALGLPIAAQVGVFAVSNAALFATVRPFERRHQRTPALITGTAALAGRNAVVTEPVSDHAGRVKIGGESWAARPLAHGSSIPAGSTVAIARVDGATVVVYPEEL
jgi:membrane protein implicated in regulation of membrane protease activity